MRNRNALGIALLAFVLVSSVGSLGFFGSEKKEVLAVVGDKTITVGDFEERVASFPPQVASQLEKKENKIKLLNQMIDEQVLVNEAMRRNYDDKKNFKEELEKQKRGLLVALLLKDEVEEKVSVKDSDVKKYYDDNDDKFSEREQRSVSHILVQDQDTAKKVVAQLKKGAKFTALASQYSIDPSGKSGGSLGYIVKGQLVPSFEIAAFSLRKEGDISDIVKTNFGYHVIRLDEVSRRPAVPYDQVKDQIKQSLLAEQQQDTFKDYLAKISKSVTIKKYVDKIK